MPIQTSSLTGKQFGTPSLPSGPTQAGQGAYGVVPTVPSPQGTQAAAIAGNLGNLSSLTGLTGQLNQFTAGQAAVPYQLNLPNYTAMTGTSSGNILSKLQGQVPADVAAQIQQLAAERGVSTGSIGSPNANAALLRSLGLTSLDLTNQGEQQLSGAVARTPTGYSFNPAQFLVSPGEQQAAQYGANVLGAAPNPAAAAAAARHAAEQGFQTGLGTGGGVRGVGGIGATDMLGFPIQQDIGYGAGGAPEFIGGALGTPGSDLGQSLTNWNQWNQSMPWNQQGAQPSFSTGQDWMEQYGVGTPAGTNMGPNVNPFTGADQWSAPNAGSFAGGGSYFDNSFPGAAAVGDFFDDGG